MPEKKQKFGSIKDEKSFAVSGEIASFNNGKDREVSLREVYPDFGVLKQDIVDLFKLFSRSEFLPKEISKRALLDALQNKFITWLEAEIKNISGNVATNKSGKDPNPNAILLLGWFKESLSQADKFVSFLEEAIEIDK